MRPVDSSLKKLLVLCGLLVVGLGPSARAEETPDTPMKVRTPVTEAGVFVVPWGVAYTRSALGASFHHDVPLIQQPGVLWDSTRITFGLVDWFGYVNNSLAGYVEIVPIAFFKLRVSAAYDILMTQPLSGGVRTLTENGLRKLASGELHRDTPSAVDWVNGKDNPNSFTAPIDGRGLRVKVMPTLQAKLGQVGMQYNFTLDFNSYEAGSHGPDTVYHDTFTFTLRKLRDVGYVHELLVVYDVPGIPDELRVGLVGKQYHVVGTGLDSQNVSGLVFWRPAWRGMDGKLSPWAAGYAGANLKDPMHPNEFSWVLATGVDFRL